jgi:hypothetical protein
MMPKRRRLRLIEAAEGGRALVGQAVVAGGAIMGFVWFVEMSACFAIDAVELVRFVV